MRKCLYILFAFLFLIALALMVNGASSTFPLLGKMIILDAGHGGKDGGAEVGNVKEKDVNLRIVKVLKDTLEEKGANVILTRTGDDDLSEDGVSRRKKSDFDKSIEIIEQFLMDNRIKIKGAIEANIAKIAGKSYNIIKRCIDLAYARNYKYIPDPSWLDNNSSAVSKGLRLENSTTTEAGREQFRQMIQNNDPRLQHF